MTLGRITYLVLQSLMFIQVVLAHRQGFLWPWQRKASPGKRIAYYLHNGSAWSDLLMVPLLSAYIVGYHGKEWSWGAIGFLLSVTGVITLGLTIFWAKSTHTVHEAFGEDGVLSPLAWVHGFYMTLALGSCFLFYLASRKDNVTPLEAYIVTALIVLHTIVGIIGNDYRRHGRVDPSTFLIAISTWIAIAWGCWYVLH